MLPLQTAEDLCIFERRIIEWIGQIPKEWELVQTKRHFRNIKRVVGDAVDEYERLALTMHGVLKRSKEDSEILTV